MPTMIANLTTTSAIDTLHVEVHHSAGFIARRHFRPDTSVAEILEWLEDPATEAYKDKTLSANFARLVEFDNDTGHVRLWNYFASDFEKFDPYSEESLAKFVKTLKRLAAPKPTDRKSEQLELPILPTPTEEQLAARTIYSQTPGLRRRPQPRYNKPAASAERSRELIQTSLAKLLRKSESPAA